MKLKKELRAVKEINEQARRERDEQERTKQQQHPMKMPIDKGSGDLLKGNKVPT
jgi:Antp family protein